MEVQHPTIPPQQPRNDHSPEFPSGTKVHDDANAEEQGLGTLSSSGAHHGGQGNLPRDATDTSDASAEAPPLAPWRDSSRFLGREPELEQLKSLKEKIIGEHQSGSLPPSADEDKATAAAQPTPNNVVDVYPAALVWGVSGTGKSALVDHFLSTCCSCDANSSRHKNGQQNDEQAARPPSCTCCYVLRGKYDEYTGKSDPFSAIVQTIQDFTTQLKRGPKEELDRMRECVRVAFPTGGFRPLVKLVPSLAILSPRLTVRDATMRSHSIGYSAVNSGDNLNISLAESQANASGEPSALLSGAVLTEKTWNQLQYIFVQFIKAISTQERPIYMFLDDLQWSASIGLDLIAGLVADMGLRNFLLLGAIRQETDIHNEEPLDLAPDHPLSRCLIMPLSPDAADDDGNQNPGFGYDDVSVLTASVSAAVPTNQHRDERRLHQITLTNLTPDEMAAWLSIMLDCDGIETLSKKLHAKTKGNIYFTLQALEALERKGVLAFSSISQQWEWRLSTPGDDERSNASSAKLPVSDSINGLIESKLRELPTQLQQVLSVAAYIRSMFDISVLHRVLENECKHADSVVDTMHGISTTQELSYTLEHAVLERLISNPIGGTRYHFAHDRIQQAAYGMIPFGEARDKLRVRIGSYLLKMYRAVQRHLDQDEHGCGHGRVRRNMIDSMVENIPHKGDRVLTDSQSTHSTTSTETFTSTLPTPTIDDGLLFVAADHLNSVQTKDHMFSVIMNLEVGEKAMEMAAIQEASAYLQRAHTALRRVRSSASPKDGTSSGSQDATSSMWDDCEHYDICLHLYRARADIELSLGNYDVGYKLCEEVLERARSSDDKILTFYSMSRALGREARHFEALDLDVRALQLMNGFPKSWFIPRIVKSMLKIRSFMKKNTNDDILSMPLMTDPRKIFAMKISADLAQRAQIVHNMPVMMLNLCKMVCRTIKYGICQDSSSAFVTYGFLMGATGDHAMAHRCTVIAHAIADRTDAKSIRGIVCLLSAWYISAFRAPFKVLLPEFRKGYLDSMEVGEFDKGLVNYQCCISMGFFSGLELRPLLNAVDNVLGDVAMYKLQAVNGMAVAFRNLFRFLLEEDEIDWSQLEIASKRDMKNDPHPRSDVVAASMQYFGGTFLATYHHRYDIAEGMLRNFIVTAVGNTSFLTILTEGFFSGLIAAARHRERGDRRHLSKLQKMKRMLRQAASSRGTKWLHQAFLLEAEELAITVKNKRHSRIQHAYSIAILTATQAGCIHEAALANELAGEHYLRHGCKDLVGTYFVHAVDYYRAWGCKSKVTDLKQRRKKFLKHLNNPNRKRPKGLQNDGNGNYLFGITRDAFTGAITTRCAGLEAFADRTRNDRGGCGSEDVLMLGSEIGESVGPSGHFADDDEVSVLTDIE